MDSTFNFSNILYMAIDDVLYRSLVEQISHICNRPVGGESVPLFQRV